MLLFCFVLTSVLFYYSVIVPVVEAQRIKARQEFNDAYRAFKLYYVKKHYESAKDLSYDDLKSMDYDSAYQSLSVSKRDY